MRGLSLGLLLPIFLLFSGCDDSKEVKSEATTQKHEDELQYFTLALADGTNLNIKRHARGLEFEGESGKAVLLSFFATWCPPCKAEIPHLVNLKNNYQDKLEIVGILMQDSKTQEEMQKFIDAFHINYKIAISEENQKFAKALGGVRSIPFMILYDKNSNYYTHYIGAVPEEMIELDLKRALEEK